MIPALEPRRCETIWRCNHDKHRQIKSPGGRRRAGGCGNSANRTGGVAAESINQRIYIYTQHIEVFYDFVSSGSSDRLVTT
jgi:hypothetical protein